MEAKPIITCHGKQTLFSFLHPFVAGGLPKDVCEWKRPHGRPPRSVQLEGSFVPYDADILPEEDTKTLVSRPYFHIYWTDCDLDSYKQSVRDDLLDWQAELKAKNIPDWMIVVVILDESKVKSKLLPRSSVIDKVRNDFCSKQPERSVVLIEPLKNDSKSSESSWNQFFQKLRSLLLQAYNRHLNKYEENMRSLREKRNEPGWSYFDYFAVQEELGFMLEILGLREDALIQYDELDAMFDQFVANHASGDAVKWLTPLLQPCTSWAGLSLAKPIDLDLRGRVKRTMISLLEFRNYLFCRQAALLFSMGRTCEVAERAFGFLQNTVTQMESLEVKLPDGALHCWVILSGLEVLEACQKHQTGQLDRCSMFTAHLWDHVRGTLKELGQLCSLMPGVTPTSEQLHHVLNLKAGVTLLHDQESVGEVRPVDKLHEALSSSGGFKKHYLEMCELAMGTYKHISRFRSARAIGRELASFYMKIGEAQKAEAFLLDAVRMYKNEGWFLLASATMRELADCQKQMGHTKRFIVTASKVACSRHLSNSDRDRYFTDAMKAFQEVDGLQIDGGARLEVSQLSLSKLTVKADEEVTMTVQIINNFPQPVTCESFQLAVSPCIVPEGQNDLSVLPSSQFPHTVTIHSEELQPSQVLRRSIPQVIGIRALYERRQERVVVAGIACDNAHEILRRTDSVPTGTETSNIVVKADYGCCFTAGRSVLTPGLNTVVLVMKASVEGRLAPSQLCVRLPGVELLTTLPATQLVLNVACYRPAFTITPKHEGDFLAGINQAATLTLNMGSHSTTTSSTVTLVSPCPVTFCPAQGGEGSALQIPAQEPHSAVSIPISVFSPQNTASGPSEVECSVEGWSEKIQGQIKFIAPLTAAHRVYTARDMKYIQIELHGNSTASVKVSKPEISGRRADFSFINPGSEWIILPNQDLSFVWELKQDMKDAETDVQATFTCCYTCQLDRVIESRTFSYTCLLSEFQTWYVVEYNLSGEGTITATIPGTQLSSKSVNCMGYQSGVIYSFYLCISPVSPHQISEPQQLLYRVTADPTVWAFAGKITGVFTLTDKPFRASLKVIPLSAGYQHLPKVSLYQYVESQVAASAAAADIWVKRAEAELTSGDSPEGETPEDGELSPKEEREPYIRSTGAQFVPFSVGRVYNASLSKQVHVFPTPASSDFEVIMVTNSP